MDETSGEWGVSVRRLSQVMPLDTFRYYYTSRRPGYGASSYQGQVDQGDRSRPEGVAGQVPEGAKVGRDLIRLRARICCAVALSIETTIALSRPQAEEVEDDVLGHGLQPVVAVDQLVLEPKRLIELRLLFLVEASVLDQAVGCVI